MRSNYAFFKSPQTDASKTVRRLFPCIGIISSFYFSFIFTFCFFFIDHVLIIYTIFKKFKRRKGTNKIFLFLEMSVMSPADTGSPSILLIVVW